MEKRCLNSHIVSVPLICLISIFRTEKKRSVKGHFYVHFGKESINDLNIISSIIQAD